MDIVTSDALPGYTDEDVLAFLRTRRGILDGVCITGGEPTLYKELPSFIRLIKDLGFKVKLDTNGTNPQMLGALLDDGLLDYVAMDIKSSLSSYEQASGVKGIKLSPIKESIDLLMNGKCEYEFRTTCVREFMNMETVKDIAVLLKGATRYFLQGFVMSDFVPDKTLHPIPKEEMLEYRQILLSSVKNVELRGID